MIERYITLACVSNEVGGNLIGNALFLGVPLKDLLEEAGPCTRARTRSSGRSVDGFTAGTPTAVLMDGRDAMLAVGMNGAAAAGRARLPGAHGGPGPVRVRLGDEVDHRDRGRPRSTRSTRTGCRAAGRQQGPIKTESRIDTPSDGRTKTAGQVVIAGVAWAQHRGISKVEVRVDDGPWQAAPARRGAVDRHLAAVASDLERRPRAITSAGPRDRQRRRHADDVAGTASRRTAPPATTPSA